VSSAVNRELIDPVTRIDAPLAKSASNSAQRASGTALVREELGSHSDSLASGGISAERTVSTPLETLRMQEVRRTRAFVRIAVAMAFATFACSLALQGDPTARNILFVALAGVVLACGWLERLLRDHRAYTNTRALICAYVCSVAAVAGIHFFGPFSPATMVLPFGLYFFCAAQSFAGSLAIYLTSAVSELVLAGAVVLGVTSDRGLIAPHLTKIDGAAMLVLVEVTMLATFLVARATRRATLLSIEEHDMARNALSRREALLEEAKQDLERALACGGLGRFSDATLGSFRLGRVLGRGAMGEVYEATHVTTGNAAAVKLLQSQALAEPDLVRRFMREAEIAASLDVPNVVRVHEVGGLDARLPYIAMERLSGEDLSDHLRRRGRLSLSEVLRLVREVGAGLAAAHDAGIVHRDIKPRNVFFADVSPGKRTWKILDFGVSKLLHDDGSLTLDRIVGTPGYMAPEQASGRAVTPRTDIYALGVIAYRALTGRPVASSAGMGETLVQVMVGMPPAPSVARPERPRDAEGALHTDVDLAFAIALAKEPDERFETGADFAMALDLASRGRLPLSLRLRAERLLARHPWAPAPRTPAE
jgi:serine/threonine-protein kinase